MKLSFVAFAGPIPVPGTHWRLSEFTTERGPHPEYGWDLEDDDGRVWFRKGDIEFYTYAEASCVPALRTSGGASQSASSSAPPVVAPDTGTFAKAKKGKR